MKVLAFLHRQSKGTLILAAVAGILSGVANTGLLALINAALHREGLARASLLWPFIGLCLAVPITRIVAELMLTYLGQRTIFRLRIQMCRRVLATPLRHLETLGAPKILATLTDDIPNITALVTLLPLLSINFAIVAGCLAYLGWLSWQLLVGVLVLFIIGTVTYQLPVARAYRHFEVARREQDDLLRHFRALTEGAKELKLHLPRRESFFSQVLEGTADRYRLAAIRGQKIYTIASSWGQLLVFVVIGVLLFGLAGLGLSGVSLESMGIGQGIGVLTGYVLVLLYLMTPLQELMNSLPGISRAEVALRRVQEMGLDLDEHRTEAIPDGPVEELPWHSLRLEGVTHVYRKKGEERDFVLGPVDFQVKPGELVIVAGGNGSGKTTLAKVLTGLYPPDSGKIFFAGEEVTDETREAYRQHFSAVFSDFYLFEDLLGMDPETADRRGREYLRRLQLEEKVSLKEGRLSTLELSQGQRKRLALLTAYLEDRPIYLFDEWAADQDPLFKEIFYHQLLPELKRRGKTVIVISHDDRYYDVGDRVVKLDYGKIVAFAPVPPAEQVLSVS